MAEIDLTPTEEMAANAARGLELRRKHGKGGTEIGVARARDISNRKNLSPETVRRMHAFFSRHEKNKAGGEDDAGYIAWLLWGGDSGQSWAKRKVEQMDKGENQRSDTYKEIAQRLGSVAKMGVQYVAPRSPVSKPERKYRVRLESRDTGKTIDFRTMATSDADARYQADAAYGKKWQILAVIEEHSRPGAKAKFSNGDKNRRLMQVLADADRRIANQVVSNIAKHYGITTQQVFNEIFDAEAEDLMDYVTEPVRSAAYVILQKKGMMSRPGAKAKFGMTNAGYKALVDAIRVYGDSAPAAVVAQAKQMKQEPTEFTDNEVMAVIAKMKQSRASRPGAKAHNALYMIEIVENGRVTSTITPDQFRSWAVRNIPGVSRNDFLPTIIEKSNEWMRKFDGSQVRIGGKSKSSRPGAKAKMGKQWREGPYAFKNKLLAEDQMQLLVNEGSGWMNAGVFMDESDTIEASKSYVQMRKRGFVYEHGQWNKARASRPGEKAKMAKWTVVMPSIPDAGTRHFDSWEQAKNYVDTKMGGFTALVSVDGKRYALKHALGQWEKYARPGAKIANAVREGEKVSASDDAVSRKIRKLMDEGKPQKQAVAIALDLERRGEL